MVSGVIEASVTSDEYEACFLPHVKGLVTQFRSTHTLYIYQASVVANTEGDPRRAWRTSVIALPMQSIKIQISTYRYSAMACDKLEGKKDKDLRTGRLKCQKILKAHLEIKGCILISKKNIEKTSTFSTELCI